MPNYYASKSTTVKRQDFLKRDYSLASGLANLSDRVRVLDRDGADLGFMIVAEAQRVASEQGGELVVITRDSRMTVVRIVLGKKAPDA